MTRARRYTETRRDAPKTRAAIMATGKVRRCYMDTDGMWAQLADGFVSARTACRLDHEDTWTELLRAVREAIEVEVAPEVEAPAEEPEVRPCGHCGIRYVVAVDAPRHVGLCGVCVREVPPAHPCPPVVGDPCTIATPDGVEHPARITTVGREGRRLWAQRTDKRLPLRFVRDQLGVYRCTLVGGAGLLLSLDPVLLPEEEEVD